MDLDRHLVVRAADAARLHFETRLDVVNRLLEHLERIVSRLFLHDVHRLVHDLLGGRALSAAHDRADELGDQRALIDRVRRNLPFGNFSTSRHDSVLYFFGRLAPYFERPCMRPATPTVSSVPRTT